MPAGIRIYFEGHNLLKPGFDSFFKDLKNRAREKRCRFELISSKSGEQGRRDLAIALKAHRNAWTILLRDSEGPLRRNPAAPHADRVFRMVEMMESWFHADQPALADFYGAGFRKSALKANPNVEKIPKEDLEKGLRAATGKTVKGNYFDNKTSHGRQLLAKINPTLVRQAAPNCERLFQAVRKHLT
jgi:hypothetical protein